MSEDVADTQTSREVRRIRTNLKAMISEAHKRKPDHPQYERVRLFLSLDEAEQLLAALEAA